MKNLAFTLALALLSTSYPASAPALSAPSDQGTLRLESLKPEFDCKDGKCKPTRLLCFNLFCSYEKYDESHKDGYSKCQVGAVFNKRVTFDGEEILDRSEPNSPASYTVECDGQKIFNNGGRRFTESFGTRIQALGGPYPATLLPKNSLKDVPRHIPSALELGDQSLKGSCYIYTGQQLE